jgi:hypothetical protein
MEGFYCARIVAAPNRFIGRAHRIFERDARLGALGQSASLGKESVEIGAHDAYAPHTDANGRQLASVNHVPDGLRLSFSSWATSSTVKNSSDID